MFCVGIGGRAARKVEELGEGKFVPRSLRGDEADRGVSRIVREAVYACRIGAKIIGKE